MPAQQLVHPSALSQSTLRPAPCTLLLTQGPASLQPAPAPALCVHPLQGGQLVLPAERGGGGAQGAQRSGDGGIVTMGGMWCAWGRVRGCGRAAALLVSGRRVETPPEVLVVAACLSKGGRPHPNLPYVNTVPHTLPPLQFFHGSMEVFESDRPLLPDIAFSYITPLNTHMRATPLTPPPPPVFQFFHGSMEVFESDHTDTCDVSTIISHCEVLTLDDYLVRPAYLFFLFVCLCVCGWVGK